MRARPGFPLTFTAVLAATVVAPAAAVALPPPAKLRASVLETGAKVVTAGRTITVAGTLRNSGGRGSTAALTFKLRSTGRPHVVLPLGALTSAIVPAGRARRFRATLRLEAALPAKLRNPYAVVVCVRRKSFDQVARCRRTRTTLVVKRAKPGTTAPPTVVTPTPTPAPTPTTPTSGSTTPTDTTAPATTDDVPATYRNGPVTVALTAADEAGGSGVAATYFTKGTAPADPTTMSGTPYDPAARPVLADNEVIKYRSVDVGGNVEAVRTSRRARVDTVAPVTTDDVVATPQSVAPRVTLSTTDAGGSSVERTYYAVGTTPANPTTASPVYDVTAKPTLLDGQRIKYFSVDFAGNAEAVRTSAVADVDPAVYTDGARDLNDTLFPDIGGGGYNAQHYDLDLDYVISTKVLSGTATATLKATQNLSRFTLDFAPWLRVSGVRINGTTVAFTQAPAGNATPTTDYNLDITPAAPGILDGTQFDVAITYSGVTQPVIDPDGAPDGWIPDPVRGAIAVSEPIGAMGWFPNNNVPFDKATYTIAMSVPDVTPKWNVIATGDLESETVSGGRRTYVWQDPDPTASYLASVSIAKFDVVRSVPPIATNPTQVPFYTAVDSSFATVAKTTQLTDLNRTPAINTYFAGYFGVPYPFNAMGGVNPRQSVGYSLETQGKPTYAVSSSATSTGAGIDTVAHENGHMLFGDYVTLTQWKDIWLNEGMTEFAAWLWSANEDGGPSLSQKFAEVYSAPVSVRNPGAFPFEVAPADPTAAEIFDYDAMYARGAATMTAIHEILGDASFKVLMNKWLTEGGRSDSNGTTEQFIALVKAHDPARAARWGEFFQQWLYTRYTGPDRPSIIPQTFDAATP